jgi:CheY-like chemotaxis protein
VECAENGYVALNLLNTGSVNPDVIILDMRMPIMDGWEFLEERKKHPNLSNIPVIIVSSEPNVLGHGIHGRVGKPVDVELLLQLIDNS